MTVVKKSVALHPVIDSAVRKLWAMLIEKGYDATYSTALNALILGGWVAPSHLKGDEFDKYFDTINSFLNDAETVREINAEELASNYERTIRFRVRQTKKLEVTTETEVECHEDRVD